MVVSFHRISWSTIDIYERMLVILATLIIICVFWLEVTEVTVASEVTDQEGLTVSGIYVDVIASSPTEARFLAFAEAESKALQYILKTIVAQNNQSMIPKKIDNRTMQKLVYAVAVDEEKSTTAHYVASLSISFKPWALHSYLKELGIPYTEPIIRPVLVVPLFRGIMSADLESWEDTNPWVIAWKRKESSASGLVPIVVLSNELTDLKYPQDESLTGMEIIQAVARRVRAERVAIVQAIIVSSSTETIAVELKTTQLGSATAPVIDYFFGKQGDTLSDILDRAIRTVTDRFENSWYQQVATHKKSAEQTNIRALTVLLAVESLNEWLEVKRILSHIQPLSLVILQALTCTQIQLHFQYVGDEVQLATALAQYGLKLDGSGSVQRLIRTTYAISSCS